MKIRCGKEGTTTITAKEKRGAPAKRHRAAVLETVNGKILQKWVRNTSASGKIIILSPLQIFRIAYTL